MCSCFSAHALFLFPGTLLSKGVLNYRRALAEALLPGSFSFIIVTPSFLFSNSTFFLFNGLAGRKDEMASIMQSELFTFKKRFINVSKHKKKHETNLRAQKQKRLKYKCSSEVSEKVWVTQEKNATYTKCKRGL